MGREVQENLLIGKVEKDRMKNSGRWTKKGANIWNVIT